DHKRQLMRTIVTAIVVVAMLLFWVWQRFGIVETGYVESALQAQMAIETARNRQLRLEVEMLRAPQLIETQATRDLHMVAPTPDTTLVIERPTGTRRAEVVR
ncbi:MAG TPA: cell division protein FtsL, partial [Vicinamibacterales bacterium]